MRQERRLRVGTLALRGTSTCKTSPIIYWLPNKQNYAPSRERACLVGSEKVALPQRGLPPKPQGCWSCGTRCTTAEKLSNRFDRKVPETLYSPKAKNVSFVLGSTTPAGVLSQHGRYC